MAKTTQEEAPRFSHGLDTPKFTVVEQKDGYEVRQYSASMWVGTEVSTVSRWSKASEIGFMRLFNYISGTGNAKKEKIPMTVPAATKIVPGRGLQGVTKFTVLFFVPSKYQSAAPAPNDPNVELINLPPMRAYVIQYSGFPSDGTVFQYMDKLTLALEKDGVSYVKESYYCASYDTPYTTTERHNEVWFLAKQ